MNRKLGDVYAPRAVPVGTKIWFGSKRYSYTVRASNTAFAVLTRPFNIEKTVLYTIIDWELGIRGPSNLIWGTGAETDEQCLELLDKRCQDVYDGEYIKDIAKKLKELES